MGPQTPEAVVVPPVSLDPIALETTSPQAATPIQIEHVQSPMSPADEAERNFLEAKAQTSHIGNAVSLDEERLLQHAGRQVEEGPDNQPSLENGRPEALVHSPDEEESAARHSIEELSQKANSQLEEASSLPAQSAPIEKSYFKWLKGPIGNFFRKMEEKGYIPMPGDGLKNTLVKSLLLPVNFVKTAVKSIWEWGERDIERLMNNLEKWNLLPKSTKQSESSSSSTPTSFPPPITPPPGLPNAA